MATATLKKHLTHLDEWQKMVSAGVFPPECRLELIQGEIIDMAPIGPNHAGHIMRLTNYLAPLIHTRAIINVQNPLQLGDLSEPQPDFLLLKPTPEFYCSRHPTAQDVLLLIEVADSSLAFDQNQKLRLYAMHSIPEYWLLNLNEACLEVYRKPRGEVYAEKITLISSDSITLSQLSDITLQLSKIL